MATEFEQQLRKLNQAGTLPGGVYLATDASGNFTYTHSFGVTTTSPAIEPKPQFTPDTRLIVASCTKLFTAVAVLQVVESGQLSLDEDLRYSALPELKKLQIIDRVDDDTGCVIMKNNEHPITLRHLLTHTSGLGYDLVDPTLLAWHTQHGTTPWSGPTIPSRMAFPLQFAPGSGWHYGVGTDWAGLAVERASGRDLESFMRSRIWEKLGITKATFQRELLMAKQVEDGHGCGSEWAEAIMLVPHGGRLETNGFNPLGARENPEALPLAVPLEGFSMLGGLERSSGGGGLSCSASELLSLLKAVLTKDKTLLSEESWNELLEPQLGQGREISQEAWEGLNAALREDDIADVNYGMNLPRNTMKSWSLAGLVNEETWEVGRGVQMKKGTVLWGGMTGMEWFVDRETGLCGLAAPHLYTFGQRQIHDLNGLWLSQIYSWHEEFHLGKSSSN